MEMALLERALDGGVTGTILVAVFFILKYHDKQSSKKESTPSIDPSCRFDGTMRDRTLAMSMINDKRDPDSLPAKIDAQTDKIEEQTEILRGIKKALEVSNG